MLSLSYCKRSKGSGKVIEMCKNCGCNGHEARYQQNQEEAERRKKRKEMTTRDRVKAKGLSIHSMVTAEIVDSAVPRLKSVGRQVQ